MNERLPFVTNVLRMKGGAAPLFEIKRTASYSCLNEAVLTGNSDQSRFAIGSFDARTVHSKPLHFETVPFPSA